VGVTAFASDADATNNSVSYAITGGTGSALFAVDAATGVVTTAAAIDREALGARSEERRAGNEAGGPSAAQACTITINDVNEFAVSSRGRHTGAACAWSADVSTGELVGVTAFASDADATNNSVSYAITGGTGSALFAVDAATGVVTTAAAIDREALGA